MKTPSSMKALKCSRVMKRTSKAEDFVFTTVIKALLYSSTLSSEISIIDHYDCTIESCRPPFFELVDELERKNGDELWQCNL